MEEFAIRVRHCATISRFNATSLGKAVGIASSTAANYWAGKRPWPTETLPRLAEVLGVSIEFLLRGEDPSRETVSDRRVAYRAPDRGNDDLVDIAEIDLRYGLGGTFIDSDEGIETEQRQFSRAWLQRVTDSPPALLFWARGQGNSMSPTIEDGEIVLIDRSQTKPWMDDLIFACALGEIGMIKRLRPRADHVKLLADNAAVAEDIAGPDDHLQIIGRVVAVVKKL